ncbi:MAG: sigma-70 family RNA polymerase sigma factor [Cytophagales bacterium]|nr:sigma-70 family RNA polymerase sigma factor [Cytophagales bacterium]
MKVFELKVSEDELIIRLKKLEKSAFEMLYNTYIDALFGVTLQIVRSVPLAEDVIQDSFIKMWKNIDKYDARKGTLFTWMLNITRNTAIDKLRSKSMKMEHKSIDTIEETESVEHKIEHIGIKEIAQKLDPQYYELIDWVYFKGYTQSEVAQKLNMPLGTVKTKIRSAIMQLRQIF